MYENVRIYSKIMIFFTLGIKMSENSSVNITKYFEKFQNFPNQKFSTDQAYFRCDLNDIESNDLFLESQN